jgi:CheY-like chemotaxis protein
MDALGQLTGGIAHDFNNLLTGIIGSLDIVRRRMVDGRAADIARFMDAASASAQRAAALTHRLLAFARRQSLDTKPSDVNALVLGMEELLHRTLGEQVSLRTELMAGLWPALADDNQLENAILNLAINARDAMPDGGQLTIETANIKLDAAFAAAMEDAMAGDYVMIAVSDTGSGMPPDVVEKAFDPFFTTKPIGEGTGLGLSMIYGFVKQSAGHVRIYSEVGKGTTIKIFLRRAEAELAASPQDSAQVPLGQGETVLVVEDDAAVRLIITDVLEELGYRHLEAPDGITALPILQSAQRVDLLVTDVGLPKMNGRQLAEMARAARPALKVLFVTGYAEKAAVRHGFLEPGMEMLMKPFTLDSLATKVREMLPAGRDQLF